ncbi:MAG: L-rhamnose mutarotase [Tannerella sp.]|jgi:L-rhamnose mutarotase|nr:L-rhamnose mutarotase [Tannerella sp.]
MKRKAFLIQARPGLSGEYKKRHNPIWPELKQGLQEHGVRNYSIFLHENSEYLFGYFEVENEALFNKLGEREIMQRWWKHMTEVLICENDGDPKAKEEMLVEIFHLD